jgi:hypothetical protein
MHADNASAAAKPTKDSSDDPDVLIGGRI